MSVLRTLESKIAGLVEGTFSRAFKSEVRPVELARKLARECDAHRVTSLKRTYVPNEYVVWLSPQDRERLAPAEGELRGELAGYLLEHARSERVALLTSPQIEFETDERLRLGEFGIQARLVRPAAQTDASPVQGDFGHTMVHSTADRVAEPLAEPHPTRRGAQVRVDGRVTPLPNGGGVIGRSRECEVTVEDPNVSRRHAEIRPSGGSWIVSDLGSTNGIKVNGRRVDGPQSLRSGDTVDLGTSTISFELE